MTKTDPSEKIEKMVPVEERELTIRLDKFLFYCFGLSVEELFSVSIKNHNDYCVHVHLH